MDTTRESTWKRRVSVWSERAHLSVKRILQTLQGMPNEFKTIREETQSFLKSPEGKRVDFKYQLTDIREDLVAFANSDHRGHILIGVSEVVEDGKQRGEVVGCDVSDGERLKIMNWTKACDPPVDIELCVENTASTPFFRIDIPPGDHRPYCTDGGKYSVRVDGQTRPLKPAELKSIVAEEEADTFKRRFEKAARGIEERLEKLSMNLQDLFGRALRETEDQLEELQDLSEKIRQLEGLVAESLHSIEKHSKQAKDLSESANMWAEEAQLKSQNALEVTQETKDSVTNIRSLIKKTRSGIDLTQEKLDSLIQVSKADNPEQDWKEKKVEEQAKRHFTLYWPHAIRELNRELEGESISDEKVKDVIKEDYQDYAESWNETDYIQKDFEDVIPIIDVIEWVKEE